MAEWRLGRGWTEAELVARLVALEGLAPSAPGTHEARLADPAWDVHGSRSVLAAVPEGPPAPDGPFARGREALAAYAFSDPSIVEGHYRPGAELTGRRMLLELKAPLVRYLCGVVVGEVRDEERNGLSAFGFRYDTLEGHVERGSEWFVLEQVHGTGELRLRVEATWQPGDFPNGWSRLGFALVGRRYQRRWHRRAHRRMRAIVTGEAPAGASRGRRLAHAGPRVEFTGRPPAAG